MNQKEDTNIQAILFADSFQTKFLPLSQDLPKVLMPIANSPMIDYTIKFLKDNRIKDIVIFTSNNRNKIEEYFKKIVSVEKKRGCDIKIFSTEDRTSVGQALRDINSKGMIHSEDVLLIFGDVLANFDLSKAISDHIKRKKERSIMTKIFRRAPLNSPLRTRDDDCIVILDSLTSQVLEYRHVADEKEISFNLEKINLQKSRNNIEVHYDWIDTDITLCSKEIFHLLEEQISQDFRDEFIKDVLNSEISEDRIHAHVLNESDFVVKVSDFRVYGFANRYVTSRWLYPVVPSTHDLKLKEKNNLRYSDFNLYLGEGVNIAYSAQTTNNSIIGRETIIDEGSTVERSTVGRNCKIGKNVKIIQSIIWNNVTINDDCVLERCLVADGSVVGSGTKINPGTILSLNVEIASNSVIPEKTLIMSSQEAGDNSFLVKGKVYKDKEFKLEDEEYFGANAEYFTKILEYPEDVEQELSEDDESGFKEQVTNLLEARIKENAKVENVVIELEASRLSSNATFSDCITHAVPLILQQIKAEGKTAQELAGEIQKTLKHWNGLFKAIVKSERDEGNLIQEIETFCHDQKEFQSAFHIFLQLFFTLQILGDTIILEWAKEAQNSTDEIIQKFYKLNEQFLEYLQAEDEEDEDEDEEEEDGGDEEEEEDK